VDIRAGRRLVVSVVLFANQSVYTGPMPRALPWVGDSTFLVGFAVAGGVYWALTRGLPSRSAREPEPIGG
jgi:hypothetical protein